MRDDIWLYHIQPFLADTWAVNKACLLQSRYKYFLFLKACEQGWINMVKLLINSQHFSQTKGKQWTIEHVNQNGTRRGVPHSHKFYSYSVFGLLISCWKGHSTIVEYLVCEKHVQPRHLALSLAWNPLKYTVSDIICFHNRRNIMDCESNRLGIIKCLVPKCKTAWVNELLFQASSAGNLELVKYLVPYTNVGLSNAINRASGHRYAEVVKYLLNHRHRIIVDNHLLAAFSWACETYPNSTKPDFEIINAFIEYGLDNDLAYSGLYSLLTHETTADDIVIMNKILEASPNLDTTEFVRRGLFVGSKIVEHILSKYNHWRRVDIHFLDTLGPLIHGNGTVTVKTWYHLLKRKILGI